MIIYQCDICGAQNEANKFFVHQFHHGKKTVLLCAKCEDKVIRFIESHKESPTEV